MVENQETTLEDETNCNAVSSELLQAEQRIVPKSTRTGIYRQVLLTILVTPIMISLAHSLAFPALIVSELRAENATLFLTEEEGSWYTSAFSLASPFGSMIGGCMMDRYGRKITLATPLIPIIIMWIITATAQSHAILFTSRVFLGICGGFGPPICQIYLAEIADAKFRGVIINFGYVSLSVGFLLTFGLGAMMNWRHLAWSGILFPLITLAGLTIIPESPIWLIQNGHIGRAYQSFLWLRGDTNIARNEINENLARINKERKSAAQTVEHLNSWRDFIQPSVSKPIVIIFTFILLFNLTGTYLIIYYAIDILSQVNLIVSPHNASVILSFVRLCVTIVFCWLFTRVKRRNIYLSAGIGSTFSTLVLATYLHNSDLFPSETLKLWVAGSLLIMFVATNTGFMIAPGFMTGELLPAKIRGRLAGCIYTYFSIVTFVLNKFFPNLKYIGITGVIFVFGLASLATTLLIYFMVPETKDKSLLEIEKHFQMHGWIYKSNREDKSSLVGNA